MTTARDIIRGTLRLIRAVDAGQDVDANDIADGLTALNQMLANWENQGVLLNYQPIELTDDLPFPLRDHRDIRYCLALDLAAEFGNELTPEVAQQARESLQTIQAHYSEWPESRPDLSITNRLSRYGNVYNINTDAV